MNKMKCVLSLLLTGSVFSLLAYAEEPKTDEALRADVSTKASGATTDNNGRWSKEKANQWYAKQLWLVGCNFIPSTAINQLEMWQCSRGVRPRNEKVAFYPKPFGHP